MKLKVGILWNRFEDLIKRVQKCMTKSKELYSEIIGIFHTWKYSSDITEEIL